MTLKIKSATNYNSKSRSIAYGKLLAFFAIGILISFFIEDREYANGSIILGFLVGVLVSIRTKLVLNEYFVCNKCNQTIESKIKNSGADYEPILYHCINCEILWYTGNVSN